MVSRTRGDGPRGLMLALKSRTSCQSQPRSRATAKMLPPCSTVTPDHQNHANHQRRRCVKNPSCLHECIPVERLNGVPDESFATGLPSVVFGPAETHADGARDSRFGKTGVRARLE